MKIMMVITIVVVAKIYIGMCHTQIQTFKIVNSCNPHSSAMTLVQLSSHFKDKEAEAQ